MSGGPNEDKGRVCGVERHGRGGANAPLMETSAVLDKSWISHKGRVSAWMHMHTQEVQHAAGVMYTVGNKCANEQRWDVPKYKYLHNFLLSLPTF